MAERELGILAEAQRETVRALSALTERLRRDEDKPAGEERGSLGTTAQATLSALTERLRRDEDKPVGQERGPLGTTAQATLSALTERLRRDEDKPAGNESAALGKTAQAALSALTERLPQDENKPAGNEGAALGRTAQVVLPLPAAELQRALDSTSQAVGELGQATATNTQALTGLARELGGLPGLLAGLAGGGKGGGAALGSVLKSGLGLVPLGLKIAGLFRDRPEAPAPPTPYAPPESLALEVANVSGPVPRPRVERGESGRPRVVEEDRTVMYQPQVTVNVSAMDSRSFLDHSADIAGAVREAMLHMHPVNDFISEL